uniref:Uncharacterized protein n=1 Tax=Anguilla anguilla TaxID=7936 RepID=A0A0E9XI33_ANGAN
MHSMQGSLIGLVDINAALPTMLSSCDGASLHVRNYLILSITV